MPRNAHVLYRFFDTAGQLLYIGMTNNPSNRFTQHQADKGWWAQIGRIELQHFSNRAELQAAEKMAIHDENPLYNKAHKSDDPGPLIMEPPHPWAGRFFHTTEECSCGRRVAEWQGRVISGSEDRLFIELFEWGMGESNGRRRIDLNAFMAKCPILYDSASAMRDSYDRGLMSHRWCVAVLRAERISA